MPRGPWGRCPGQCRPLDANMVVVITVDTPVSSDLAARSRERDRVRVAVGVHAGTVSGIDTFAEHLAVAAAAIPADVTLLVTNARVAEGVTPRLRGTSVSVGNLGMSVPSG